MSLIQNPGDWEKFGFTQCGFECPPDEIFAECVVIASMFHDGTRCYMATKVVQRREWDRMEPAVRRGTVVWQEQKNWEQIWKAWEKCRR